MIFIDSNVPMYLIGQAHRHKTDAQRLVEAAAVNRERMVTSAEVYQEILHRYVAIRRRDAIQPAFDALSALVEEVFAIERQDTERAREIVLGSEAVSARDALHLAVMARRGVSRIASYDRGFDGWPGVVRLF